MKIRLVGSTHPGYCLTEAEMNRFAGMSAGICYMKGSIDDLLAEPMEKSIKRAGQVAKSGHHSCFGHTTYNFVFEGIPKIIAMVLNNERPYNTSEKSARYTKMKLEGSEKALYEKWKDIYFGIIKKTYPYMEDSIVEKLSMENARYVISVFTPSTVMEYTVDTRQMSYILDWMHSFITDSTDTPFNTKLKTSLQEFVDMCDAYYLPDVVDNKNRQLSMFGNRVRAEEYGESYSMNYCCSLATYAQLQRHRTIRYEIMAPGLKNDFFVPDIIKGTDLEIEWISDMESVANNFPQGMLIHVNERGTCEDFVMKCKERLCGSAQLEVMHVTRKALKRYFLYSRGAVQAYLKQYMDGPRCTYKDFKCTKPCIWGPVKAFKRKI